MLMTGLFVSISDQLCHTTNHRLDKLLPFSVSSLMMEFLQSSHGYIWDILDEHCDTFKSMVRVNNQRYSQNLDSNSVATIDYSAKIAD